MDRESARQKIQGLVEKFHGQQEYYEGAEYNETQCREDFVNPLFAALGWDIENKENLAPSYRSVRLENRLVGDGTSRASDYSFWIGKERIFLVEAKKPSVNLGKGSSANQAAFQLRRYGWSANLAVSIVTNFKELVVYDCTKKPHEDDKASTARLNYLMLDDYTGRQKTLGDLRPGFDYLWEIFGYENLRRGGLEKYLQTDTDKKGILPVDDSFLQFLEDWRHEFASSIFRNNKELTEWELNFAVQQIIDRIVFLRFAEDRSIEHFGDLVQTVSRKTNEPGECYRNLYDLFDRADDKYNSGLFNMNKDHICRNLIVENKLLLRFVKQLYFPGPYDFQAMPVEILGSAYERFLGKVVRIAGNGVRVEEKPEVRKSGGVYYTPQYIVDYIVENTVGKLLEGKTPKEAEKIKIVDPACGSGSFLLGAYQFLLDWHHNYYVEHFPPSKGKKSDPLTPDGQLTIESKKLILANNIFGVDIDVNAVEFTKLSLLLKCMEGETSHTLERLKLYHERMLPNIDGNICCGNSLVETDFYDMYPDNGEEMIIKPFHWQRAFPDAFKQGGFDIVIGNPPWEVTLGKDNKEKTHATLEKINLYCKNKYQTVQGEINLYKIFAERDINLIKEDGRVGLIMPTSLLNDQSNTKLRQFIASKFTRIEANQFPERARVFKQITQDVCIYIFTNDSTQRKLLLRTNLLHPEDLDKKQIALPHNFLSKMGKIPLIKNKGEINILKKLNSLDTFHDKGFIKFLEGEIHLTKFSEAICAKAKVSTLPLIRGDAVRRYFFGKSTKDSFINEKIAKTLSNSPKFQDVGIERLVYQQVVNIQKNRRLNFQLLTDKIYVANTCGYVLNQSGYDIKFILGLFNSSILNWRYKLTSSNNHILTNELYQLPFPLLDLSKKEDKQVHDKVVHHVDQLLRLYVEKDTTILSTNLYTIEDKIAHFEKRIDELIYQLYGLTAEEITVIEGQQ